MFYRRKVLLALLQSFEGQLEKIALQKLLFLLTNKQENPAYDFIPYHYGSYSISANADLIAMEGKQIICKVNKSYKKLDDLDYFSKLILTDQIALREIEKNYSNLNSNQLMKVTYEHFHYYAINSKTAETLLDKNCYKKVLSSKPKSDKTILFTIGYEGISLEEYLNRLIKNDVKVLVDVRYNPLSRKFGFSKNKLKTYCEALKIEYMHVPEVGIRSEYRKELKVQKDYDKLFEQYKDETLKTTEVQQLELLKLLEGKKRIALTCFESEINKCHRNHLANAIVKLPEWNFELKHI